VNQLEAIRTAKKLVDVSQIYVISPFKKSPFYALPQAWNDLSPFIKYQNNRTTFKWALKAHLLDELTDI
jgi:hypothetical protein